MQYWENSSTYYLAYGDIDTGDVKQNTDEIYDSTIVNSKINLADFYEFTWVDFICEHILNTVFKSNYVQPDS